MVRTRADTSALPLQAVAQVRLLLACFKEIVQALADDHAAFRKECLIRFWREKLWISGDALGLKCCASGSLHHLRKILCWSSVADLPVCPSTYERKVCDVVRLTSGV